ncbi:PREDICTED: uncharacterized protein LOC105962636 [Erythranthe guttata]|uniref:uncharacterized protein LOC105962636 n=1 Tax=Erythranthe guttata TaxID=4155 RepID=UPI00064D92C7|nr:PREDICTED: uncharacterized protein LOC105962636 [Erythranthe guttata]|eukprot:XP_012842403.1 PREDICTED: uncharacterized protein LOC105962636 [Erythranthe guttata]
MADKRISMWKMIETLEQKKCGCPFKLIGTKSRFDELWLLTVIDGKHTHPQTLFPHRHGTTSHITPQQKARIQELKISHVKPMFIMDRLRKDDPIIQTSMKHVYRGYRYWHRVDSETSNAITDVMVAFPKSIKLLRLFVYVILMDCTYKTDKYKMTLLEMIGITPVGNNFMIVVAFMPHEGADTYEWTLN